jgi:serine protease Do
MLLAAAAATLSPARAEQDPDKLVREGLRRLPQVVRAAVDTIRPSLVRVETFGVSFKPAPSAASTNAPSAPRRPPAAAHPLIGGLGPGTGVVFSEDGLILTSTFVLARERPVITVVLADGSRHMARVLGSDQTRRLCMLRIDNAPRLTVPRFLPREAVRTGQWAVSIGYGYGGDQPAVSVGCISARDRFYGRAVQTDANLSPANYGGPLIDVEGRVIGICVPMSPQSSATAAGSEWYDSGIGFAVPASPRDAFIKTLAGGRSISIGFLGVAADRAPAKGGVAVAGVTKGSPAEAAGIMKGDLITDIDGHALDHHLGLRNLLANLAEGDTVEIRYRRDGTTRTVNATLAAQPVAPSAPAESAPREVPVGPAPDR